MIDIHSHILPGIDDGAKTEQDSLEMARAAVKEGITTIVATPHHRNGSFDNDRDSIRMWVDTMRELIVAEDIPLTILPGQETRMNGDMVEELKSQTMLPINDTRYVFVEFPSQHVPRYASQMLFDIQVAGYIPVIVHPERNQELMEHHQKLYNYVKKGALTQVTAGSLIGRFGKDTQKYARQLIEANQTHFIASDAHNTTSRGFYMREAFQFIEQEFGSDYVFLFQENSHLMIENENVNRMEPEAIKRKKFLGIF